MENNDKYKKQKKTRQFTMWVNDYELEKLRKLANENNTSMSQYIRNVLFYTVANKL